MERPLDLPEPPSEPTPLAPTVAGSTSGVRDLVCTWTGPADVQVRWWRGDDDTGISGERLRADATAPGEEWRCSVELPGDDTSRVYSEPWTVPTPVGGNLLVIVIDDVGTDRIGLYGTHDTPAHTPTIDSLAAEGVRFETAYASPACSTSRAWTLTGRFGWRYGLVSSLTDRMSWVLPTSEVTIADLWTAGAPDGATAAFGKWHLATSDQVTPDLATAHGFDEFEGTIHNLPSYASWQEFGFDGALHREVAYPTERVGQDAIDFVTTAPEPWFGWVAFHAAHAPYDVVPDEDLAPQAAAAGVTTASAEAEIADAMLEGVDTEIAGILDALEPEVRARTTVVVFGDNGTSQEVVRPPLDPLHAKSSVYEAGVRVPLIVAGPAVAQPGTVASGLVHVTDVLPTVADLLGWPLVGAGDTPSLPFEGQDVTLDGRSLLPQLVDPGTDDGGRVLLSYKANGTGEPAPWRNLEATVRDHQWKLVRRLGQDELYDVSSGELPEGADRLTGPRWSPLEERAYQALSAELDRALAPELFE